MKVCKCLMNSGNSFDDVTDNKMKKHPNFGVPVYGTTILIAKRIGNN